jgi:deoxyribonuclease-4
VTVLLETTAGQGTVLGWRFEQLARMIEDVRLNQRIGLCVDTCHILAAGYDIRTPEAYESTFADLDRLVGLDRVRVFHLNDSQKALGTRVDRHTHIGQGFVGLEAFRLLVNDPRFASLPMIIETPKNDDMAEDVQNIALLTSLIGAQQVPEPSTNPI